MKFKTHPHKSDLLTLTEEDLRRIGAGEVLQISALVIELEKEPKPDFTCYARILMPYWDAPPRIDGLGYVQGGLDNLKITFDGETGVLKSAEVLK